MLIVTLTITVGCCLFERIIGFLDKQTGTPTTEELVSLFSALGAEGSASLSSGDSSR